MMFIQIILRATGIGSTSNLNEEGLPLPSILDFWGGFSTMHRFIMRQDDIQILVATPSYIYAPKEFL